MLSTTSKKHCRRRFSLPPPRFSLLVMSMFLAQWRCTHRSEWERRLRKTRRARTLPRLEYGWRLRASTAVLCDLAVSPAPSSAPSSCSRPATPAIHTSLRPSSLVGCAAAASSYTSLPPFLTPTRQQPYIDSLHLRVCTHTTNRCGHNLYPTCSNSTRSYLYTLRTTNFFVYSPHHCCKRRRRRPTSLKCLRHLLCFGKLVTSRGTCLFFVHLTHWQGSPLVQRKQSTPSISPPPPPLSCPHTQHKAFKVEETSCCWRERAPMYVTYQRLPWNLRV